jgi:hypothetical protein
MQDGREKDRPNGLTVVNTGSKSRRRRRLRSETRLWAQPRTPFLSGTEIWIFFDK